MMPIFEDINYEIQDPIMFRAVNDCREYIARKGTKSLLSKIWYVARKYKLPFVNNVPKLGNLGLKHHVFNVLQLYQDKMHETLSITAAQTYGYKTDCTMLPYIDKVREQLGNDILVKAILNELSFDQVTTVIVTIPRKHIIFEAPLKEAIIESCTGIPVKILVEFE